MIDVIFFVVIFWLKLLFKAFADEIAWLRLLGENFGENRVRFFAGKNRTSLKSDFRQNSDLFIFIIEKPFFI